VKGGEGRLCEEINEGKDPHDCEGSCRKKLCGGLGVARDRISRAGLFC